MENKKWEYKIVYINANQWRQNSGLPEDINERFDEWGAAGWELVKIVPRLTSTFFFIGSYTEGYVAFFKKEKQ